MTPARIVNLRRSLKTNKTYACITKRDDWVKRLQANKTATILSQETIAEVFEWATNVKVSEEDLLTLIDDRPSWRKPIR